MLGDPRSSQVRWPCERSLQVDLDQVYPIGGHPSNFRDIPPLSLMISQAVQIFVFRPQVTSSIAVLVILDTG